MPGFFENKATSTAKTRSETYAPLAKQGADFISAVHPGQMPVFVDVGGSTDCGFRAIAAAVVDKVLTEPGRANQELLSNLLALYYRELGPSVKARDKALLTPMQYLKPTQYLEQLIKNPENPNQPAQFIVEFGWALRQAGVREMRKNCLMYPGAFVNAHEEQTSLEQMRQQTTLIDESMIAAIANVTGIAISLSVLERGKLPMLNDPYNSEAIKTSGTPIVIQLQLPKKHYVPQVMQPERFEKVAHQTVNFIPPATSQANDPNLADIMKEIAEDQERLVKEFDDFSNRLFYYLQDTKMSKAEIKNFLIKHYIKGIDGQSGYLQGRIKQVGLENGNQDFFAKAIDHVRKGEVEVMALSNDSYDEQIIKELVHALARAMVIGDIDPAKVFDAEDYQSTTSMGMG